MAKRLVYLSQFEIDDYIQELACQIEACDRKFSRVVGIVEGGLHISIPLAKILRLPHESVRISWYDGKTWRDIPFISGKLSQPTGNLVVDDLINTGRTMKTFSEYFGLKGNAITVIHWTPTAPEPDFWVMKKKPKDWIVYPWEEKDGN